MMEIKTIKDISKFIRTGKTPPTQEVKYFDGEVNWYTPGDLDKGKYLSTSKRTLTKLAFEEKKAIIFPKNTLIVGCIGDIGKLGITIDDCSSNQQLTGIYPNDNVDVNYLYYWFKGNKSLINSFANNAVVPILNNKTLETIKLPLPPLPQQQKIANILDAADALRQNDKALIAKYDELTQSLFLDMFGDVRKNEKGWKQIALEKICDVGSSKRVFVDELVEHGIPFYRGTEIGQMSLNENITPSLFITAGHYEKLKNETGVPKIGDLLMPSICPDGRIFEVSNDNPFYFKDGRVLWIKVNQLKVNSVYLKKHLKGIFAVDYTKIASGTTFAELKIFALKKLVLHHPPLELQNQFAERVAVIEAQKAIAQASLKKSEELFNSLLQKAFKGELV